MPGVKSIARQAWMSDESKAVTDWSGSPLVHIQKQSLVASRPIDLKGSSSYSWNDSCDLKQWTLEKIPDEGEFSLRIDLWAGLIASCGSFYPMVSSSQPNPEIDFKLFISGVLLRICLRLNLAVKRIHPQVAKFKDYMRSTVHRIDIEWRENPSGNKEIWESREMS